MYKQIKEIFVHSLDYWPHKRRKNKSKKYSFGIGS